MKTAADKNIIGFMYCSKFIEVERWDVWCGFNKEVQSCVLLDLNSEDFEKIPVV